MRMRISLLTQIVVFGLVYAVSNEELFPIRQGSRWIFSGTRITADRSETTHYNYVEEIVGRKKIDQHEYFVLRSGSDESESDIRFTYLRVDSTGLFARVDIPEFKDFELLYFAPPLKEGNMWHITKDTTFLWREGDNQYRLRFCTLGVFGGKAKVETRLGSFESYVIDNIYSQELIITDAKGDTVFWDNKEELHRLYVAPDIGPVKNVEIDAIGNTRTELLENYYLPKK